MEIEIKTHMRFRGHYAICLVVQDILKASLKPELIRSKYYTIIML